MKRRLASSLILFGVLTAGCAEILGEDFSGYRMKCKSGSSSCSGGGAGVAGFSGGSAGESSAGSAGKKGAAGHGGKNEPPCLAGVECGDPDLNTAGSAGSAGRAENAGTGGLAGGTGSAGSGGNGGSVGGAGSDGNGGSVGGAGSGGVAGSAGGGGSAGRSDVAGAGGNGGSYGGGGAGGGGAGGGGAGGGGGGGNSSGSGGAAGSGSASGSGGTTCQPAIAECQPSYLVSMPVVQGIGMYSAEQFGGGFEIFAAKRGSTTVANLWNDDPGETVWKPWGCFHPLPQGDRLAANALIGGSKDVFATTRCGELYRSEFLYDGPSANWHDFELFGLPPAGSAVTDVAITEGMNGAEVVYVADAGRVFARPRLGTNQAALFGDWFEVSGVSNASLVTAGLRSDGRLQVFTIDASGSVQTAIQSTTDSSAPFGAWSDFDDSSKLPRPILDIEAPNGGPLPLEVFAVDANGSLWQRAQDKTNGVWGPWRVWDGPLPPDKLTSLTGAGLKVAKNAVRLTVLTQDGIVYSSKRTAGTWDDWRWFP